MDIKTIASIAHEVNRAYCQALGDDSQVPWTDAPDWQQVSAIKGVVYHSENPESKPSDSHDSWLAEKKADGWKYGPMKDADKKEHPCYVPYEDLPVEQKAKDYIFKTLCEQLILKGE